MNTILKKDKITIVDGNKIDISTNVYLNNLARERLKTITGIRDATRKLFSIKKNVPIYLDKTILLIEINDPIYFIDRAYINYVNITLYEKNMDKTLIIFSDETRLEIHVNIKRFESIYQKAKMVYDHMNSIQN